MPAGLSQMNMSKKEQILDVSLSLFLQKGFDKTSINDILKHLDIARGTLYYHFESKEAIMDAIIERASKGIFSKIERIVEDTQSNVLEKIYRLFLSMKMQDISGGEQMIDYLNQPQNALFHEKSNQMIIEKISPLLGKIICEGVDQKLFNTEFPYESAEVILICMMGYMDTKESKSTDDILAKTQILIYHIERILGARRGSLSKLEELSPT